MRDSLVAAKKGAAAGGGIQLSVGGRAGLLDSIRDHKGGEHKADDKAYDFPALVSNPFAACSLPLRALLPAGRLTLAPPPPLPCCWFRICAVHTLALHFSSFSFPFRCVCSQQLSLMLVKDSIQFEPGTVTLNYNGITHQIYGTATAPVLSSFCSFRLLLGRFLSIAFDAQFVPPEHGSRMFALGLESWASVLCCFTSSRSSHRLMLNFVLRRMFVDLNSCVSFSHCSLHAPTTVARQHELPGLRVLHSGNIRHLHGHA
jgi:hypothetical protein